LTFPFHKGILSNPEKKTYTIYFPKKENNSAFDELEREILKDQIKLDTSYNSLTDSTKNTTHNNSGIIHKVVAGETWQSVADKYGVSVDKILMWNMLEPNENMKEGMEFVVFPATRKINSTNSTSKKKETKK
jgi:LysM repeat protein